LFSRAVGAVKTQWDDRPAPSRERQLLLPVHLRNGLRKQASPQILGKSRPCSQANIGKFCSRLATVSPLRGAFCRRRRHSKFALNPHTLLGAPLVTEFGCDKVTRLPAHEPAGFHDVVGGPATRSPQVSTRLRAKRPPSNCSHNLRIAKNPSGFCSNGFRLLRRSIGVETAQVRVRFAMWRFALATAVSARV